MMLKWCRSGSSTQAVAPPTPDPGIGEQRALADEFGAFAAADPAGDADVFDRLEESRAFGNRLGLVDVERGVHRGAHQRPQIVQAGDRDDVADAVLRTASDSGELVQTMRVARCPPAE